MNCHLSCPHCVALDLFVFAVIMDSDDFLAPEHLWLVFEHSFGKVLDEDFVTERKTAQWD